MNLVGRRRTLCFLLPVTPVITQPTLLISLVWVTIITGYASTLLTTFGIGVVGVVWCNRHKKSCIRETLNLLTNADSITIALFFGGGPAYFCGGVQDLGTLNF